MTTRELLIQIVALNISTSGNFEATDMRIYEAIEGACEKNRDLSRYYRAKTVSARAHKYLITAIRKEVAKRKKAAFAKPVLPSEMALLERLSQETDGLQMTPGHIGLGDETLAAGSLLKRSAALQVMNRIYITAFGKALLEQRKPKEVVLAPLDVELLTRMARHAQGLPRAWLSFGEKVAVSRLSTWKVIEPFGPNYLRITPYGAELLEKQS